MAMAFAWPKHRRTANQIQTQGNRTKEDDENEEAIAAIREIPTTN